MSIGRILISFVAASAVFSASQLAQAQYQNRGLYAGVQVGYADLDYNKNSFGMKARRLEDDSGVAYRALIGYGFNRYVATEMD